MFHTIDSVIKDFTKARDKLIALTATHQKQADLHQNIIDEASKNKKLNLDASTRAAKLAENISKIID